MQNAPAPVVADVSGGSVFTPGEKSGATQTVAPDLDLRVGERWKALAGSLPSLCEGPSYLLRDAEFQAPLHAAAQRAIEAGVANVDDFVVGEALVQLERARAGAEPVGSRSRGSPLLELALELQEIAAAAQRAEAVAPDAKAPLATFLTTNAAQLAGDLSQGGAPASFVAFVLSCLQGSDATRPAPLAPELETQLRGVAEIFQNIAQEGVGDTAADPAAAFERRVRRVEDELWPSLMGLVQAELQSLAQAEATPAQPSAADPVFAAGEPASAPQALTAERALRAITRNPNIDEALLREAPTPSYIVEQLGIAAQRGELEETEVDDRLVVGVLELLHEDKADIAVAHRDALAGAAPASRFLLSAAEAKPLEALVCGAVDEAAPVAGGAGSAPADAAGWLRTATDRYETARAWREVAQGLEACEGLTAEIGRTLSGLQSQMAQALDQMQASVRGNDPRELSTRAQARSTFDRAAAQHSSLLRAVTGLPEGRLQGLAGSGGAPALESLRAPVLAQLEQQRAGREFLSSAFSSLPEATAPLRGLVEERLRRSDEAMAAWKSGAASTGDVLQPLFDGAWIAEASTALREAWGLGDRLAAAIQQLPEDVPGRAGLLRELEEIGDVRTALVGEASRRIAEQCAGVAPASDRPLLARYPRLSAIVVTGRLASPPLEEMDAFAQLAAPLQGLRWLGLEAPDVSARGDALGRKLEEERSDFQFWCRNFDLQAPGAAFLREFTRATGRDPGVATAATSPSSDRLWGDALLDELAGVSGLAAAAEPLAQPDAAPADPAERREWAEGASFARRRLACEADAQEREVSPGQQWADLAQGICTEPAARSRLLAILDLPRAPAELDAPGLLGKLMKDPEPLARGCAALALATLARQGHALANVMLAQCLQDKDPRISELAGAELWPLVEAGGAVAADAVVQAAKQGCPLEGPTDALLELVASARPGEGGKGIGAQLKAQAKDALEARATERGFRADKRARPVRIAQRAAARGGSLADLAIGACGAAPEPAADRLKLALRLMSKFESWAGRQDSSVIRAELRSLDLPDAILDDALAEVGGRAPVGYLSKCSPALLARLSASGEFVPAEIEVLRSGALPQALTEAAKHPAVAGGAWRDGSLESLRADPAAFRAVATVRRWGVAEADGLCAELLDTMFTDARGECGRCARELLQELTGAELGWMDPTRPAEERAELAKGLPENALLSGAVARRWLALEAGDPEAAVLMSYLADGGSDVGKRRLVTLIEMAPAGERFAAAVDALREACSGGRKGGGLSALLGGLKRHGDGSAPWLVRLFSENNLPALSPEVLVAARDAFADICARHQGTEDRATLDKHYAEALLAQLGRRADVKPADIEVLAGVVFDGATRRLREVRLEGLKKIGRGSVLPAETLAGLRGGLALVTEKAKGSDLADVVRQYLELVERAHTAKLDISADELVALAEMLSGVTRSSGRLRLASAVGEMYRNHGAELNAPLLQVITRWMQRADRPGQPGSDRVVSFVQDLLPMDPEVLEAVSQAVGALAPEAQSLLVQRLRAEKRFRRLTVEDVSRIAEAPITMPSAGSGWRSLLFDDPTKLAGGESAAERAAKMRLRSAARSALASVRSSVRAAAPKPMESGSFHDFGVGGYITSHDNQRFAEQIENPNVRYDLAEQTAQAKQQVQAFMDAKLSGLRPYERVAAQYNPSIVALSKALDRLFQQAPTEEEPEAANSGELNVQRYIGYTIERLAQQQSGGKGGVSMGGLFDSPRLPTKGGRKPVINFILAVDTSGSTEEENRLENAFKPSIVKLLEANERVKNAQVRTAVIQFSNDARLLLPLAAKHDPKVKAGAVESMKPDGGTNDVAASILASDLARQNPADLTFVLFLTDGKGQDSQAATIASLAGDKALCFGAAGVSADAQYVLSTYPTAIAEDRPDMFDKRIFNFYVKGLDQGVHRDGR